MNFSTVKVLPDDVIKALCNTLLHSLWQGLVLAAMAALIIVCTRKQTAAKRYNLLLAVLALFALGIGITFAIEFDGASAGVNTPGIGQMGVVNISPVQPAVHQVLAPVTFTDHLMAYLNRNTQAVVLIWFIIVCARSLQLITGLYSLYYLRRKAIAPVDAEWQNRVRQLALQLGIGQVVSIAQSGLARVPMVIGHLKPLILIPAGMITALPPAEIEAILIHELAHILRKDYLANLLISLAEILFFFNPAIWWITSLIRAERENCCDDIAIAQTSSKVNYIRALVSCQEYQLSAPDYAMAFARKPNHLLNRVKRLLSNRNQSLNLAEKSLLAIGLVTTGLLVAAFSNAGQIGKLVSSTTHAVMGDGGRPVKKSYGSANAAISANTITTTTTKTITDTMKTGANEAGANAGSLRIYQPDQVDEHTSLQFPNHQYNTYLLKERGILYQLNLKGKVLMCMQVNGKAVPAESLVVYQPVITQILNDQDREPAELKSIRAADELARVSNQAQASDEKARLADAAAAIQDARVQREAAFRTVAIAREKTNEARGLAIADSINRTLHINTNIHVTPAIASAPAYAPPVNPQPDAEPTDRKLLIAELIKDGIIDKADNLSSFKLSNKEFIVNGKKQPEGVYQKFKAKYVRTTGRGDWSWYYNYDTTSETK